MLPRHALPASPRDSRDGWLACLICLFRAAAFHCFRYFFFAFATIFHFDDAFDALPPLPPAVSPFAMLTLSLLSFFFPTRCFCNGTNNNHVRTRFRFIQFLSFIVFYFAIYFYYFLFLSIYLIFFRFSCFSFFFFDAAFHAADFSPLRRAPPPLPSITSPLRHAFRSPPHHQQHAAAIRTSMSINIILRFVISRRHCR